MAHESFHELMERKEAYHRRVFATQEVPLLGLLILSTSAALLSAAHVVFNNDGWILRTHDWAAASGHANTPLGSVAGAVAAPVGEIEMVTEAGIALASYWGLRRVDRNRAAFDKKIQDKLVMTIQTK